MIRSAPLAAFILFFALSASGSAAKQQKTFTVAPGSWVSTGIMLHPWQRFETTASGKLTHGGSEKKTSDPTGFARLGFQAWTVKGKVGDDGSLIELSSASTSSGFGNGGAKGGELRLGVSNTYEPLPEEAAVTGSFQVTVYYDDTNESNAQLQGTLRGNLPGADGGIGGVDRGSGSKGSDKGGKLPWGAGLVPGLIGILVNIREIVKQIKKKPKNAFDPSDEEQDKAWKNKRLIWDKDKLAWRDPRPGEREPPEDPRGKVRTRENTPRACHGLLADYELAKANARSLQDDVTATEEKYQAAVTWLLKQLAKFYALMSWQVGEATASGVEGIRAAEPTTAPPATSPEGKLPPGAISVALEAARQKLAQASARVAALAGKIAELAEKSGAMKTLREAAELARKQASSLREFMREAEGRVTRLAELEGKLAEVEEARGFAKQQVDYAKKNVVELAPEVERMEKAVAAREAFELASEAEHEAMLAREKALAELNSAREARNTAIQSAKQEAQKLVGDAKAKFEAAKAKVQSVERKIFGLEMQRDSMRQFGATAADLKELNEAIEGVKTNELAPAKSAASDADFAVGRAELDAGSLEARETQKANTRVQTAETAYDHAVDDWHDKAADLNKKDYDGRGVRHVPADDLPQKKQALSDWKAAQAEAQTKYDAAAAEKKTLSQQHSAQEAAVDGESRGLQETRNKASGLDEEAKRADEQARAHESDVARIREEHPHLDDEHAQAVADENAAKAEVDSHLQGITPPLSSNQPQDRTRGVPGGPVPPPGGHSPHGGQSADDDPAWQQAFDAGTPGLPSIRTLKGLMRWAQGDRSQKLSEILKPNWARSVEKLGRGLGGLIQKGFGGQSAEEMEEVIRQCREEVAKTKARADAARTAYDAALKELTSLRPKLEQCAVDHAEDGGDSDE